MEILFKYTECDCHIKTSSAFVGHLVICTGTLVVNIS